MPISEVYNRVAKIDFSHFTKQCSNRPKELGYTSVNEYNDELKYLVKLSWCLVYEALGLPWGNNINIKSHGRFGDTNFKTRIEPSVSGELVNVAVVDYYLMNLYSMLLINAYGIEYGIPHFGEVYELMVKLRKYSKKIEYLGETGRNLTYDLKCLINASYLYITHHKFQIERYGKTTNNIFNDLYNEVIGDVLKKYKNDVLIMDIDHIVLVNGSEGHMKLKQIIKDNKIKYRKKVYRAFEYIVYNKIDRFNNKKK
ncbi:hypothetical protein HYO65_gp149 [Tenacibaculum phage PTm1]|nr:hypothetical protein HYO65_gp149 [Tenacibaculum phage PTm1]BBI90541.1 hypothetical protein [Tenacibaculum phage PTm1]